MLNLPFRMSGATVSAAKHVHPWRTYPSLLKETGLSEDEIAGFAGKPSKTARADRNRLSTQKSSTVSSPCGFSSDARDTALPATGIPDNVTGVMDDPEYRTDGALEGGINE